MNLLTLSFVKISNRLEGPEVQSCIGAGQTGKPRERSEACPERSDEARDCALHITQTKGCT